ncbi:type IV pilus modification PilV family protein [Merismopedia glauca]|uniref:Prepilin-type cleavage/methylation domain-containing protein n=1 Tax=Merismopedia glauca CCAP 1448/3 TaxID=1296344 RepID=A0A2T1C2Q2_9CYAN|nr:type II secretion system protein [Merismopedia glauca]PSB02532.1 hypothetical protein C7B64_12780 [Merismopedia glauca CCAP 1448/3]
MHKILLLAARKDKGLTLVEVLIATLIVIVFIAVSLQALTVAALFKSRGKLQNEAISLIQKDLERIRTIASTLSDTSRCKATVVDNGYAQALNTSLTTSPNDIPANEFLEIAGINYEKQRTATVSGGTASGGSCKLNACYETLKLNYKVKGTGAQSGLILADVETEVIPDAAFQCPL